MTLKITVKGEVHKYMTEIANYMINNMESWSPDLADRLSHFGCEPYRNDFTHIDFDEVPANLVVTYTIPGYEIVRPDLVLEIIQKDIS